MAGVILGLGFIAFLLITFGLMMFSDDILPALKSSRQDRLNHELEVEKEKTRQKELELEMFKEQQKSIENWKPPQES
jgi:hypothetical protein